jgi:RNA polymerase sigma-70 factor (ECF subfamily)
MTDAVIGNAKTIEATVRLAATGDHAAFSRLVAEHHASMARVAFVVCGDAEVTQDAVQSAWSIAWRRIGSLRNPTQVHAWLVAIAANEARQAVRRRRRVTIVDLSTDLEGIGVAESDTLLELVDLQRVLLGLKPEERGLLGMRFAAGLEYSEIAEQLGMSASGVRSRVARLLERIRVDLALDLEGDR